MQLSLRLLSWTSITLAILEAACGQLSPGVQQGQALPSGGAANSAATKQVQIVDPVLQMKAYSWTIPSNWIFEGALMGGNSCVNTPFPILRMMSPDGITELKVLPRFDWTWSTGSNIKLPQGADCLPLDRVLSAAEFLKYMAGILNVTLVSETPGPGLAELQQNIRKANEQFAANAPRGVQPLVFSGDQARSLVRYSINTIPVEEYLTVTTRCSENTRRFGVNQVLMHLHACSAILTRGRARQGQLEAMQNTFQNIGKSVAVDPQWTQAWQAREMEKINEQTRRGTQAIIQAGNAAALAQKQRFESFQQGQEMRQRQHEEFLSTMQRGTDLSMRQTQDSMNARSRMAGDWADYALDQQKRLDPRTGAISKDSSQYSYSWVDESGQHFQSNDVNDNPNGRLKGNWTLQQNIH